jgi:hypothetical protein
MKIARSLPRLDIQQPVLADATKSQSAETSALTV